MVVRSLDVEKDPFRPRDDGDKILGLNVPSGLNVHFLMPLDPPNTIGWDSRISFDISKASNILSWFFSFQINLNTNIIGYIDQIINKLSIHT